MSGHAVVNGRHECFEPIDALCRAVWGCGCEWFHVVEQMPDGTWTHTGRGWDEERDDEIVCRSHLQPPEGIERRSDGTKRLWCNVVEWIDCQGPWDCWISGDEYMGAWSHHDLEFPDGPIRYAWGDEWLEWDYDRATPELGRFIARYVVECWADDLGVAS